MKHLDAGDREVFIDTVFNIISAPGVSSFSDWPLMAIKEFDSMIDTLKNIDSQTAEKMKTVLFELAKSVGKNFFNIPDKEQIMDFITEKVIHLTKKEKA